MPQETPLNKYMPLALGAFVIIAGAAAFFLWGGMKTTQESGSSPVTNELEASLGAQLYEETNPGAQVPQANPFEAEANPFENQQTNPFSEGYRNPFE